MAVALRGLRVRPQYEDLINVAISDQLSNIKFSNRDVHIFKKVYILNQLDGEGQRASEGRDELEAGDLGDFCRAEAAVHDQVGVAEEVRQQDDYAKGADGKDCRQHHLRDEIARESATRTRATGLGCDGRVQVGVLSGREFRPRRPGRPDPAKESQELG